MKKMVNGTEVDCSPEEILELAAQWEKNDPAKKPPSIEPITAEDVVALLISKKIISEEDVTAFSVSQT